jgi:hypothetical protein
MGKEKLIVVTEDNMEEVFNESIYPTLAKAKTPKKMGKIVEDLLNKYTFEDELMKVRFLIPVIDAVTKTTMDQVGLEFKDMDQGIKQQIGWNMVNTWFNNGVFIPMKLINYGDILNPNTEATFKSLNVIDPETQGWLQKEAKFITDGVEKGDFEVEEKQLEHLKTIIDGELPFGLQKAE